MDSTIRNLLFFAGAVVVLGFLARSSIGEGISAVADINEGTPFEGTGVVGAVGNVTNVASGGVLANIGSAIGQFFSGSFFDRRTVDDLTGG